VNVRVSADRAGWSIREAAWGFEEGVLWRGSDAARGALDRASERLSPLQRLVQTRLTWPLGDAYRARSRTARTAIAASAAAVAIAAGSAGALMTPAEAPSNQAAAASPIAAAVVANPVAETTVLQGVTPEFRTGNDPLPTTAPTKPAAKPAQVAWSFAQAFVAYEVGQSNDKTAAVFAQTATKPLAKALAKDPPRLPARAKVPQARVLNVVLGDAGKQQVTASVSLVRMRAISEVRLTLAKDGNDWRVAQVLG
jgi:hypothetical protein